MELEASEAALDLILGGVAPHQGCLVLRGENFRVRHCQVDRPPNHSKVCICSMNLRHRCPVYLAHLTICDFSVALLASYVFCHRSLPLRWDRFDTASFVQQSVDALTICQVRFLALVHDR